MADVTMRQMLEAGVHFGHQTRYWSPKMAPYIYGKRNNIHIFNLESSLPALQDAANFLGKIASKNGRVLFVGTKRAARDAIKDAAQACNMPYVNRRWSGGMMTNFKTVKISVKRLLELEAMVADGSMERLSKKEALGLQREMDKLERGMGGIKHMERLPDALFIVDVGHERIAVAEAKKLGIPVVAIVDSNNTPEGVDYVIPGNDDAIRAVQLYSNTIASAVQDGKRSSGKMDEIAAESDAAGAAAADAAVTDATVVIKKASGATEAAAGAPAEAAATTAAPAEEAVVAATPDPTAIPQPAAVAEPDTKAEPATAEPATAEPAAPTSVEPAKEANAEAPNVAAAETTTPAPEATSADSPANDSSTGETPSS